MFTYPIYKALKLRLTAIAPVFFYIGQYQQGKDNTSYKVPAIYVETPKNSSLTFYGKKLLTAKDAKFRVHYISYAPFKNHDSAIQDSAIAAHEAKMAEIDKLITGWNVTDPQGKLLTQQFLPVNSSLNNFLGMHIYSIIDYNTEIYSRHLAPNP